MCCCPIFEPSEDEIRGWVASGAVLEEAGPEETGDGAAIWRAKVRDPRGFWIAFKAEERLLMIFGPELVALGG